MLTSAAGWRWPGLAFSRHRARSRGAKQGRQWADSTPPVLGPHGGPQHAFGPLGLHHASPIDRWLVRLQAATVCTVHAPAMDSSLESSQYWQASLPATLGVAIVLFCTNFLKAAVRGKGKIPRLPDPYHRWTRPDGRQTLCNKACTEKSGLQLPWVQCSPPLLIT